MYVFRTVHELATSPPAAGEHEPPLIPQHICAGRGGISLVTQYDVVRFRPATAGIENGRYPSAGSVVRDSRPPNRSIGSNTRNRSHNSVSRTAFLEHGFRG